MSTEPEELIVAGQKVKIDPAKLKFNETTLSEYLQLEGGWYDNYGGYLAMAERFQHMCDQKVERIFAEKFVTFKDKGGSDKLCESKAKADEDYQKAKEEAVEAKYIVQRLKYHLRGYDKNHDNAMSFGYNLRKELDKLNPYIKGEPDYNNAYGSYDEVNSIVRGIDLEDFEKEAEED